MSGKTDTIRQRETVDFLLKLNMNSLYCVIYIYNFYVCVCEIKGYFQEIDLELFNLLAFIKITIITVYLCPAGLQ